jgi:hypothetical protein
MLASFVHCGACSLSIILTPRRLERRASSSLQVYITIVTQCFLCLELSLQGSYPQGSLASFAIGVMINMYLEWYVLF